MKKRISYLLSILAIGMFIFLAYGSDDDGESSTVDLNASVSFSGTQFVITNNDTRNNFVQHTLYEVIRDSNVNLFSATTPRENFFDLTRQVFISKKAHELNPRTALKENDIIISTVGTIGSYNFV